MSILVELPERLYQRAAFAAFAAVSPYSLGTARAMAWMSQLAYETHRPLTIETVARTKWEFTSVTPFILQNISLSGSFETCGLIGERPGAVILAWEGVRTRAVAGAAR